MEQISAASRLAKKVESGTSEEVERIEQFVFERLHEMSDEHLHELRSSITQAQESLQGLDGATILEGSLRSAALLLSGGAIASGQYYLLPAFLAVVFPQATAKIFPSLKLKTQLDAKADNRDMAARVIAAVDNELTSRKRQ